MSRIIIDVREPQEYKMGHVKGAINIPPSELIAGSEKLKNISRESELILYCRTGNRSGISMNLLQNMGYANVINGVNIDLVESNYL